MGETTFVVDDMICRYCKDTVTRLITSINGVSSVNVNVPERTVNVIYDSRITDAHVIRMTLLEAGYKNIREPINAF
ncbi:MAG TPA: heavy-metal-associated domain-containing protein [Methanosarcina sp.]|nr:heavy-metal-associated domain-containing protein [Methanosarcina sp.]